MSDFETVLIYFMAGGIGFILSFFLYFMYYLLVIQPERQRDMLRRVEDKLVPVQNTMHDVSDRISKHDEQIKTFEIREELVLRIEQAVRELAHETRNYKEQLIALGKTHEKSVKEIDEKSERLSRNFAELKKGINADLAKERKGAAKLEKEFAKLEERMKKPKPPEQMKKPTAPKAVPAAVPKKPAKKRKKAKR